MKLDSMKKGLLFTAFLMVSSVLYGAEKTENFEEWLSFQAERSNELMRGNISPKGTLPGTVVASLSKSEPNYFYHWIRDAALVMTTLYDLDKSDAAVGLLKDYARLSQMQQDKPSPGGIGEVKYYVNGEPFTGPWGRPQNDGPALRVIALAKLANQLLDEGDRSFVDEVLYNSSLKARSVIKRDLEYVSHNLAMADFDLWEEVKGFHFFTRIVQRKALLVGAELAIRLDDPLAAEWYLSKVEELNKTLSHHMPYGSKFITATLGRTGGIDYKGGQDSSTILALLYTDDGRDEYLGLSNPRVTDNITTLIQSFIDVYDINSNLDGIGPAIGRYPEDTYDGYESRGEGNPWFLMNHGYAEYFYRLAALFLSEGEVAITKENHKFFAMVSRLTGESIEQADFRQQIQLLVETGDLFLKRSMLHADADGSLPEQFNRYTGFGQGAPNLTWSHSSFLRAYDSRLKVKAAQTK